jgi:hypothetical protein
MSINTTTHNADGGVLTVVLLSSLTPSTGNLTSASRVASYMNNRTMGSSNSVCHVQLCDCGSFDGPEAFSRFVSGFVGRVVVIAVHLFRAGKLCVHDSFSWPLALIIGGTDVNENVFDETKVRKHSCVACCFITDYRC